MTRYLVTIDVDAQMKDPEPYVIRFARELAADFDDERSSMVTVERYDGVRKHPDDPDTDSWALLFELQRGKPLSVEERERDAG